MTVRTPLALALLVCAAIASASDPKPDTKDKDKATAQEKAVKEFVVKVAEAIGKKDVDALVEMSDVPWCRSPKNFTKDKRQLKADFRSMLDGKPLYEPKCTFQTIETFKVAAKTLTSAEVEAYRTILNDDDLVVSVDVSSDKTKTMSVRMLLKSKANQYTLVGIGVESR